MKLSTYNPSVQLHNGPDAKVQAFDGGAARTFAAIGDMQGRAAGALVQGIGAVIKQQEDNMAADVISANTEYRARLNDLLYNEENGLAYTQNDQARDVVPQYQVAEAKIRQEVMKRLPNYQKAHAAFLTNADQVNNTLLTTMQKHSYEQAENQKKIVTNNHLTELSVEAQRSYGDPQALQDILNNGALTIAATYLNTQGMEACKEAYNKFKGTTVQKALELAQANGDQNSVDLILDNFSGSVDPQYLKNFIANSNTTRMDNQFVTLADQLAQQYENAPAALEKAIAGMQIDIPATGNNHGVVAFKQTDERWAGNGYGNSSIKAGGCGPTSAAMILASFGVNMDPAKAARWSVDHGYRVDGIGTGHGFFSAIGKAYGVPMHQSASASEVEAALKAGKPVIAAHGPGKFTDGGHFMVYTGMTADGKIHVNDPGPRNMSGNYTAAELAADMGNNPVYFICDKVLPNAQPAGQKRMLTPVEQQKLQSMVLSKIGQKQRIENMERSNAIEDIKEQAFALYEKGITDPKQFEALAAPYMGKKDYYKYLAAAKSFGADEDVSGMGLLKTSKDGRVSLVGRFAQDLEGKIIQGELSDNDIRTALAAIGAPVDIINSYVKKNQSAHKSNVDWDDVKARLIAKGLKKEQVEETIPLADRWVTEQVQDKKRYPDVSDIVGFITTTALTSGITVQRTKEGLLWNSVKDFDYTRARVYNRTKKNGYSGGAYRADALPGHRVALYYPNAEQPTIVTEDEFVRMMGDK